MEKRNLRIQSNTTTIYVNSGVINFWIYLITAVLLLDIQNIILKLMHTSVNIFHEIPQRPAQLVIVHVRFAFPYPPQSSNLVWILDDKLSIVPLPGDHPLILFLLQQLQNEVPQLDLSGSGARFWLVGPVWEGEP